MVSATNSVFLMGASLGTGNRGVSALGASCVGLVLNASPAAQVTLLIGQRTAEPFELIVSGAKQRVDVANFRMSPKARFREHLLWWFLLAGLYRLAPSAALRRFLRRHHPLLRASAEADFLGDIRGGDSFSDIYGAKRFLEGSLPVIAVLLVRRHIILLPQTYGPYKSWLTRQVARFILRRASIILSRDRESMATVEGLIGKTERCRFCPDVAFALEARLPAQLITEPSLDGLDSKDLIGLNVSGLMYRGGYTKDNMFGLKLNYPKFLVQLADKFLADPSRHLLLVPHTFAAPDRVESDPAACQEVRQQLAPELRKRALLVRGNYDQGEIKGVIGLCDFFIGSRMHACIAALSQGIPTVGVAYSKKFSGVFETVGAGQAVIDGRDCTVEQALQKTMAIFESREPMRRHLKASIKQAQEKLYATFDQMLGTSDKQSNPNRLSSFAG